MQDDNGMSDHLLLALCRCQAVSRMMKTDVLVKGEWNHRDSSLGILDVLFLSGVT
jgi:hypothetical protein